MPQPNVEIIRAIYDDWLRGDLALDKLDPEIAMVESSTLPGRGRLPSKPSGWLCKRIR